jgi:hypothetical protein
MKHFAASGIAQEVPATNRGDIGSVTFAKGQQWNEMAPQNSAP